MLEISQHLTEAWAAFQAINHRRRAIRQFTAEPVCADDIAAIVGEALLAPSSGNLQPYEFHWLRDATLKAKVAAVCEAQGAAVSAPALLVVVANRAAGFATLDAHVRHLDGTTELSDKTLAYYRGQLQKFGKFLRIGAWPVWTPLKAIMALIDPVFTLLQIGGSGVKHWVARSAIYSAQTLMLAASARGIDTCPMEGFNAAKVAKLLNLPRGSVIPLVIALGYRAPDARIDPRWRKPLELALIEH